MIGVDVRSNIREVRAEFQARSRAIVDKATVRALNRALDQTATEASREIRKVYNVKHAAVARAMKKMKARAGGLTAILRLRGARLGLIEFDARQTRAGASVRVKVGGGRKVLAHSFIATNSATGYRGVFVREGRARYPIRNLRSISLPKAFQEKSVLAAVKKVSNASFLKNLRQQMKFLNSKMGG